MKFFNLPGGLGPKGNPKKQSGFTLVELGLVLLIVALILIAAIVLFPALFGGTRSQNAAKSATSIISNIRSDYQTSRSAYTGLNEATAIHFNAVPSNYVADQQCASSSPKCLKSEWNQPVGIGPANINGGTNNGFDIVYSMVPSADCANFVQNVWNGAVAVFIQADTAPLGTTPSGFSVTSTNTLSNGAGGFQSNQLLTGANNQFVTQAQLAQACSSANNMRIDIFAQ